MVDMMDALIIEEAPNLFDNDDFFTDSVDACLHLFYEYADSLTQFFFLTLNLKKCY